MSDYPMLISNKLHSFRNFIFTNVQKFHSLFFFLIACNFLVINFLKIKV